VSYPVFYLLIEYDCEVVFSLFCEPFPHAPRPWVLSPTIQGTILHTFFFVFVFEALWARVILFLFFDFVKTYGQ